MNNLQHPLKFCCCLVVLVVSSCLKETPLVLEAAFEYANESPYNTTPVEVSLTNTSVGADFFEWTFEGGTPARSQDKDPGKVIFSTPGEHRITLRVRNQNEERVSEQIVRVDSLVNIGFGYQILVNDFAPADVRFENPSTGASTFSWTFEGGTPAQSQQRSPGVVRFPQGEHRVMLTVSNGSESFTTEQTIAVKPPLAADFWMAPILTDEDMEAPLSAAVKNLSRSCLSVRWSCQGGAIAEELAEETIIRFALPGTYTVTLLVDNLKEQQTIQQQITVKENSGIHIFNDLRFGISQAKNSVGALFSANLKKVLTTDQVVFAEVGAGVDIGFFALNSGFGHCYFFSPDQAALAGFPVIPGAVATEVCNPPTVLNHLTTNAFGQIARSADLDAYTFSGGNPGDYFSLDQLPVFVFFRTLDARRGIVHIKEKVVQGANSYVVADIKIEKRIHE